jgi:hypothetical protein
VNLGRDPSAAVAVRHWHDAPKNLQNAPNCRRRARGANQRFSKLTAHCHTTAGWPVFFRANRSLSFTPMISASLVSHVLAHASAAVPLATSVCAMTPGRLGALGAGLAALVGVVAGGLALRAERAGAENRKRSALVALVAGLAAVALGALVAATATGGVGTGNGLGGAFVAIVLGLLASGLGGRALGRARRAG